MKKIVDHLLHQYESGIIGRRELLTLLAGMTAAATASVATQSSPLKGISLNHVTISVSDLNKSREFYSRLLGLPILHDYWEATPPSSYLGLGNSFLCIEPAASRGIDHFCIGLETYDAKDVAGRLKAAGVAPKVEDDQVYFSDPDGIKVQLAAASYNG